MPVDYIRPYWQYCAESVYVFFMRVRSRNWVRAKYGCAQKLQDDCEIHCPQPFEWLAIRGHLRLASTNTTNALYHDNQSALGTWRASGRLEQDHLKNKESIPTRADFFSATSAPRKTPLKRKILDRKRIPDFPGFRSIRFQKKVRAFCVQSIWTSPKLAKWRPAADTSLYRDPYYNRLWEIQCIFWWFFESAGPHERSQTLPTLTNDNKYISNIKSKKIKIFGTFLVWFWGRFSSKNQWLLLSKAYLSQRSNKKGCILLQKAWIF